MTTGHALRRMFAIKVRFKDEEHAEEWEQVAATPEEAIARLRERTGALRGAEFAGFEGPLVECRKPTFDDLYRAVVECKAARDGDAVDARDKSVHMNTVIHCWSTGVPMDFPVDA